MLYCTVQGICSVYEKAEGEEFTISKAKLIEAYQKIMSLLPRSCYDASITNNYIVT